MTSLADRLAYDLTRSRVATQATIPVATLADARAVAEPADGSVLATAGRTATNDGGGGQWVWDSTSTDEDDGALTLAVAGVDNGRWKRVYSGPIDVRWFGADPTGATDSTDAINNAINALPDYGGTVLFPPGKYACNVTVTKAHTVLEGSFLGGSLTGASVNSGLVPWDTTLPVVQIGDDSGTVPGVVVQNMCIMRNGPNGQGDYGVRVHGGAMHCRLNTIRILAFNKRGLWIENGASNPVVYFGIVNFSIVGSLGGSHEAAVYVKTAAGSYIGGLHFTSGTIEASCTAGRALDVSISQPMDMANVYIQTNPVGGLGNVLIRGASHICCANVKVDGDDDTAVLVESTYVGATHLIPDFMSGTVTINGKFKFGDATTISRNGKNLFGYEPQFYHPVAHGALFLTDNVTTDAQDLYLERSSNLIKVVFPTGSAYIGGGTGTPEGVVTASPGSLFLRTDTGKLYVKESGTGNTGWVMK